MCAIKSHPSNAHKNVDLIAERHADGWGFASVLRILLGSQSSWTNGATWDFDTTILIPHAAFRREITLQL